MLGLSLNFVNIAKIFTELGKGKVHRFCNKEFGLLNSRIVVCCTHLLDVKVEVFYLLGINTPLDVCIRG